LVLLLRGDVRFRVKVVEGWWLGSLWLEAGA
jgi:hypothetical protein